MAYMYNRTICLPPLSPRYESPRAVESCGSSTLQRNASLGILASPKRLSVPSSPAKSLFDATAEGPGIFSNDAALETCAAAQLGSAQDRQLAPLGVAPNTSGQRIFAISGNPEAANLPVLRAELLARGFAENEVAPEGANFEFKWGPKHKVDYSSLVPPQKVNHFEHDAELTTKSGIAKSVQNASACADVDHATFHPQTYYLKSSEDLEAFGQHFKGSKALCVLKLWASHMDRGGSPSEIFEEGVVCAALAVVQRHFEDVDCLLDLEDNEAAHASFAVRSAEWEILQEVDLDSPACCANAALEAQRQERRRRARSKLQSQLLVERYDKELQQLAEKRRREQEEERKRQEKVRRASGSRRVKREKSSDPLMNTSPSNGGMTDAASDSGGSPSSPCSPMRRSSTASMSMDADAADELTDEAKQLSGQELLVSVRSTLAAAERASPQYGLYQRNIWILKPVLGLRGQGIVVENDLDRIYRYTSQSNGSVKATFVAQKYIENPLLIGGRRKHDIRQWVLVTSVNPLTIWFFSECYVRVAANEYSTDNLSDRFKHLTHTIIMCHHPNFDPEDDYWRCQWDLATYKQLLRNSFGYDAWTEKVLPAMKKIVIASLLCVQDSFAKQESSRCCFQIFGYDFFVDADLNAWLLEVNDIPMMHSSGPVTERLCDPMVQDAISLVLDGPQSRQPGRLQFEHLYTGVRIPRLLANNTCALTVEGRAITRISRLAPAPIVDTKALQQMFTAKREQELQKLADKRHKQEEKQNEERERKTHLRSRLAKKLLSRRNSAPSLEDVCGAGHEVTQ